LCTYNLGFHSRFPRPTLAGPVSAARPNATRRATLNVQHDRRSFSRIRQRNAGPYSQLSGMRFGSAAGRINDVWRQRAAGQRLPAVSESTPTTYRSRTIPRRLGRCSGYAGHSCGRVSRWNRFAGHWLATGAVKSRHRKTANELLLVHFLSLARLLSGLVAWRRLWQ
jgi:hypothetical protein